MRNVYDREAASVGRYDSQLDAVTDANGYDIGYIRTDEYGRPAYYGEPCLCRVGEGEGTNCVLTDSVDAAVKLTEAITDQVYVIMGDATQALAGAMRELEKYETVTLMESCDAGAMPHESEVKRLLSTKLRINLPSSTYRTRGGVLSYQSPSDLADEVLNATPRINPMLETFDDVDLDYDRYTVEKLPTRFKGLNYALYGGIPRGQLTIWASVTGTGKSTVIMSIIADAIQEGHRPVFYFGEGSKADIAETMIRQIAGPRYMREQEVYGSKAPYVECRARDNIFNNIVRPTMMAVRIPHGTRQPWTDFRGAVVDGILQTGRDIVVVDNLMTLVGLIQAELRCSVFEAQGIAAQWCESVAIDYNVWFFLVCHENKTQQGDVHKNQSISGSSDIGNSAGVIVFHEEVPANERTDTWRPTHRKLMLSKNRLYGTTNRQGWTTDFDTASQRSYTCGDRQGAEYMTRWEKEYTRDASIAITVNNDRYKGLAAAVEDIDCRLSRIVKSGVTRPLYLHDDETREGRYCYDADDLQRCLDLGLLRALTDDGITLIVKTRPTP